MSDTPQLLLSHHLKALKLPTFLREYLTVVSMSTSTVLRGQVNEPTLRGRVRSLVGLGQKSFQKLGLVARNVSKGQMAV